MPEVHLPQLDDHEEPVAKPSKGMKFPKLLLEVILISGGVFLGLLGEQWRESAHRREVAESALRSLKRELQANRKEVARVEEYHTSTAKDLRAFLAADAKQRQKLHLTIQGIQPVLFEHAAWDLTTATGALADIQPELAYSLAHVYNAQLYYAQLTQGIIQTMYLRPPTEGDGTGFMRALDVYWADIVIQEPKLIAMYDELIPRIDSAVK
jgi:hypothetical protein